MGKFFTVFVFAFLAVAIPTTQAIDRPEETDECIKKSGAVEADIFARPRKNTEEVNCFWKCVLEKREVIGANGVFHADIFEKGFPKLVAQITEQQTADIKKCLNVVSKIAVCADIMQIRKCIETVLKA